jgi:hypothetical protein
LQIAVTSCGSIVFKEAQEVAASGYHRTWEDKSVRNIAFSILLAAIAVLQVAVVVGELSDSGAQVAAGRNSEAGDRYALAANEAGRKAAPL